VPETKSSDSFPFFAIVASIFGVILVTFMLFQPVNYQSNFVYTHYIIGSLYSAICVLGVIAAFYPKKCQGTFVFRKNMKSSRDESVNRKTVEFSGHHPDCSAFSANRIKIRKTILCAACGGLLFGAIVALTGSFFYFFSGYTFSGSNPWILLVSNAGMLLGLFQYKFAGYVKLAVNAFFVICSFVTLVVADQLGKSLLIDLYVFGLIVFLLATRILLSENNNRKTCRQCKQCV
jgi:hypothetical protein